MNLFIYVYVYFYIYIYVGKLVRQRADGDIFTGQVDYRTILN